MPALVSQCSWPPPSGPQSFHCSTLAWEKTHSPTADTTAPTPSENPATIMMYCHSTPHWKRKCPFPIPITHPSSSGLLITWEPFKYYWSKSPKAGNGCWGTSLYKLIIYPSSKVVRHWRSSPLYPCICIPCPWRTTAEILATLYPRLLSFTTLKCYRSFLKIQAKKRKQLPSFLYVCVCTLLWRVTPCQNMPELHLVINCPHIKIFPGRSDFLYSLKEGDGRCLGSENSKSACHL